MYDTKAPTLVAPADDTFAPRQHLQRIATTISTPQVPRPYCIIIWRGCQTRFYSTLAGFVSGHHELVTRGLRHTCLEFFPASNEYLKVLEPVA